MARLKSRAQADSANIESLKESTEVAEEINGRLQVEIKHMKADRMKTSALSKEEYLLKIEATEKAKSQLQEMDRLKVNLQESERQHKQVKRSEEQKDEQTGQRRQGDADRRRADEELLQLKTELKEALDTCE